MVSFPLTNFTQHDILQILPFSSNCMTSFIISYSQLTFHCVYAPFIHSTILRHLGCSQILAIVNSATWYRGVKMSFFFFILFLGPRCIIQEVELLNQMRAQFLDFFLECSYYFPERLDQLTLPQAVNKNLFLPDPYQHWLFL